MILDLILTLILKESHIEIFYLDLQIIHGLVKILFDIFVAPFKVIQNEKLIIQDTLIKFMRVEDLIMLFGIEPVFCWHVYGSDQNHKQQMKVIEDIEFLLHICVSVPQVHEV